jgi:hypothetical protein
MKQKLTEWSCLMMGYIYKKAVKEIDGKQVRLRVIQDDEPQNPRTDWDGHYGTMVCFHGRYNLGDKHNYNSPEEFFASIIEEVVTEEDLMPYLEKEFLYYSVNKHCDDNNEDYYVIEDTVGDIIGNCQGYSSYDEALEEFQEFQQEFLDDEWREILSEEELYEIAIKYYAILPLYLYDHSGITMRTGSFSCHWDSGQVGWIYGTVDELKRESGYNFNTEEEWTGKIVEILESEVKIYDQYLTGDVYGFMLEEKEECECCGSAEWNLIDSCWGFFGSDFEENGLEYHINKKYKVLVDDLSWA